MKLNKIYSLCITKGPCSFDEVFFPYASDSAKVFGACHAIKFNGKSKYIETDTICLNNYGKGSKRSTSSKRGSDYGLFMGVLDFYNDRTAKSRYMDYILDHLYKLITINLQFINFSVSLF